MALPKLPGQVGYKAFRVSSMDERAIGKLTSANHLSSLHNEAPAKYDKGVISIYTQTALKSRDFSQMIDKATPFFVRGNSDSWQWDVGVPYEFPVITAIPASTLALQKPGIDNQEFELVLSRKEYFITDHITPSRRYGPEWEVVADPTVHPAGYLYRLKLIKTSPTDFVAAKWLKVGIEVMGTSNLIGEFNQKLSGLKSPGKKITLMETMSGGFGKEHTITSWADARTMRDGNGNPLDIIVYAKRARNAEGQERTLDARWEPEVERLMREEMMDIRDYNRIWSKPGFVRDDETNELKKNPEGLYWKIRNNGNLVQYNRGQFSIALLRSVFGDLFYRRVDMAQREVTLYSNEAGIEVFRNANKEDMLAQGFTLNVGDGDKFIQGSGQKMIVNWAFDSVVTMETGKITIIHLSELDEPQTNVEYGQNKKSTPLFICMNVTPGSNGVPTDLIREVRVEGQPNMTWGYVDGRRSHLGFAASQGMQSANTFPGYKIWMEDRADIFVEDLSRMVLIEERPEE